MCGPQCASVCRRGIKARAAGRREWVRTVLGGRLTQTNVLGPHLDRAACGHIQLVPRRGDGVALADLGADRGEGLGEIAEGCPTAGARSVRWQSARLTARKDVERHDRRDPRHGYMDGIKGQRAVV